MRETHLAAGRCAGALALTLGLLAPGAAAQSTGGGGGGIYVATPKVSKVTCVRRCASKSRAQGGSTIKLTGSGLASAAKVIFNGSYGRGDDQSVPVRSRSDSALSVRVPVGAVTGPITVVTAQQGQVQGHRADRDPAPAAAGPEPGAEPGAGPALGRRAADRDRHEPHARLRGRAPRGHVLLPGHRRARALPDRRAGPGERRRGGQELGARRRSPPGEAQSISWDGRLGRSAAKPGRYSFRLTAATAAGAEVRTAQAGDTERDAFDLYDNMFPIRGSHDYGGGAGTGSEPAGRATATRARTCSPGAGRRWSRRAAARSSSSSTTPRPATTW